MRRVSGKLAAKLRLRRRPQSFQLGNTAAKKDGDMRRVTSGQTSAEDPSNSGGSPDMEHAAATLIDPKAERLDEDTYRMLYRPGDHVIIPRVRITKKKNYSERRPYKKDEVTGNRIVDMQKALRCKACGYKTTPAELFQRVDHRRPGTRGPLPVKMNIQAVTPGVKDRYGPTALGPLFASLNVPGPSRTVAQRKMTEASSAYEKLNKEQMQRNCHVLAEVQKLRLAAGLKESAGISVEMDTGYNNPPKGRSRGQPGTQAECPQGQAVSEQAEFSTSLVGVPSGVSCVDNMRLILVLTVLGCVGLGRAADCELKFKVPTTEIDNKLCTVSAADKKSMDDVKKTLDDAKKEMDTMEKNQQAFSSKMQSDILTEQVERTKVKGQIMSLKQKLNEAQKKNDELKKLVEDRENELKTVQADLAKATDTYNRAQTILKSATYRASEIHLALNPEDWDPLPPRRVPAKLVYYAKARVRYKFAHLWVKTNKQNQSVGVYLIRGLRPNNLAAAGENQTDRIMKTLVAAVFVTILAVVWAADQPNLEVKEVNNKCVWTLMTDVPKTGGCPATFPGKATLQKYAGAAKDMTDRSKKLAEDAKSANAPVRNRITQALIERMEAEQEVNEITTAITNIENSNKALTQKVSGLSAQIRTLTGKMTSLETLVSKLVP
ncbi:Protein unc-80 [Branchiostoma belcheri]|nr:Protein unc-80 [Branchiostoma belcheri]